jgi:hypothetical protein
MEYVKVMSPGEGVLFPGKKVIVRTYDEHEGDYVWKGAVGAREWFEKWLPYYKQRPWVYAWEAPNEPNPMWNHELRKALDAFTAEYARLMARAGLKAVMYNWSVGWPDTGQVKDFRASLEEILKHGHFIGLHEYGAPFMNVTGHGDGKNWWTLRYRATFAEIKALGLSVPKTFITECGIDGGVRTDDWEPRNVGFWPGWRYFCVSDGRSMVQGEDVYMSQLAWYDEEIMRDPEIVAAFIFNSGDGGGWGDFEISPGLFGKLKSHVINHPTKPQPVMLEPELKIINLVGKLPTRPVVPRRDLTRVERVVIHHTAVRVKKGQPQSYYTGVHLPAIARGHVNTNGWETIAYHYAVDDQGRVYQLNNQDTLSHHTYGHNTTSIGVVLLGSFQDVYNRGLGEWQAEDPTPAQLEATAKLLRSIGKPFVMHRQLVGTQCPGAVNHSGKVKEWWVKLENMVKEK